MDDSSDARPSGTPLGRAFIIRQAPLNDDLIAAVRACASVHGDGPLPSIPLDFAPLNGVRGRFWYDQDGRPISILVEPTLPHRGEAAVHEIGHFLDLIGLESRSDFASESSPDLLPWRGAIEQSRRFGELSRAIETRTRAAPADEAPAYEEYRELPEVWARSYAQYVTIRSGDAALDAGLAAHRVQVPGSGRGISRLLHWDDDFAPIAAEIEALFRRLGWRSGR